MSEYAHHAAGVPSRLSDRERSLLLRLAIENLVRQTGCSDQDAADALDHFTERGEVTIEGDARDVYLKVVGHTHIHAERAWLRWAAFAGEAATN
ncbi:MAG TPA: hypothetical protein VGS14_11015 [Actinomycetes bacterium]|jgi:hypothetical protein|nr:hypothetical protein [Actinomycetes bacterium]